MNEYLHHYWWIILLLLIGVFIGAMRDLSRIDASRYINKKRQAELTYKKTNNQHNKNKNK